MEVAQYLFQSPSSSSVQVGRLDPSSKQEESSSKTSENTAAQEAPVQVKTAAEIITGTSANTVENISPTVSSKQLLDVYA